MRTLLLIGLALGGAFMAGWFTIERDGDRTRIEINKTEVRSDARQAIDRGRELLEQRERLARENQSQPGGWPPAGANPGQIQPGFSGQPNVQGQPNFQGQPGFQNQPNFQNQPGYQGQPGFQGQPNYSGQPGFGGQPSFGNQPGNSAPPQWSGTSSNAPWNNNR